MCGTCNDVSDGFLTAPKGRIMTRERQHALAHDGANYFSFDGASAYWSAHQRDIKVMQRWANDRHMHNTGQFRMLPSDSAHADMVLANMREGKQDDAS